MRVITGRFKGRAIGTVDDHAVRPATDRIRVTIFDMLANRLALRGAWVLDLFAGSGSLGIEALSRGAARVTFVEQGREAMAALEQNLRSLGCLEEAELVEQDALAYLNAARGPFHLVFADPPYGFPETPELPRIIVGHGLVRPGGYLLIEHTREVRFADADLYATGPEKKFGRTLITFFQPTLPGTPPL
ncbi:MAG: 16S rRNA (guanine(966)-N(2))-methyltransferase RsmD [Bacteroidota bacterium]